MIFKNDIKIFDYYRLIKNIQMQGVQALRNEAYIEIRRNDEGRSTTQQMDVFHQPVEEE